MGKMVRLEDGIKGHTCLAKNLDFYPETMENFFWRGEGGGGGIFCEIGIKSLGERVPVVDLRASSYDGGSWWVGRVRGADLEDGPE